MCSVLFYFSIVTFIVYIICWILFLFPLMLQCCLFLDMLPREGYLMSVWSCARLDKNSMLDVQTSLLEKCTHFYWHVQKNLSQNAPIFITCTYYLIGCVHPGDRPEILALIFFNQSVGSIALRQVGTVNAVNHGNQRCHVTPDPQQQIVIKMLWYRWGIVCKQWNVQIALLNFSLYYEWFNFYNPLLFSLHPTSLSKWKSQLIMLMCPAMIQRSPSGRLQVAVRSPLGDFPCLGCGQIIPGSPSGIPTENGGSPCGRLWVFFCQLHPKFPRVAERRPVGDREASCWTLANELICKTSADHQAKFNCELKCSGRWISKGWALQECLFGHPIFAGFDAKVAARWSDDRFFSIGTVA